MAVATPSPTLPFPLPLQGSMTSLVPTYDLPLHPRLRDSGSLSRLTVEIQPGVTLSSAPGPAPCPRPQRTDKIPCGVCCVCLGGRDILSTYSLRADNTSQTLGSHTWEDSSQCFPTCGPQSSSTRAPGNLEKQILRPILHLLNQKLWRWVPAICDFYKPSGGMLKSEKH